MDFVQEWLDIISATLTTSQLRTLYNLTSSLRAAFLSLTSYFSTTSPSLATVALVLIVLFISLKVLDMLWRAFIFWLRLAVRIMFWGGLLLLGTWLYTRGPEGVIEDGEALMHHWQGKYQYYKVQAEAHRAARGVRGAPGGARYHERTWW